MMRIALAPHEIVAQFMARTRRPSQAQLDSLTRRGIPRWSLAGAPGSGELGVGFARVERLDDGRFDFTDDGQPGMAAIALNEFYDPTDIVAWSLRQDWVASWYGAASVLGAQHILGPRLDSVLNIYPDPFAWLQGDRDGIVLIDERRAPRALLDVGTVRAASVAHGLRLQALLIPPTPRVVIAVPDRRAA